MQSQGRNRASTSLNELQLRIVGQNIFDKNEQEIRKSGAFDGCQVAAVAFAFNKKAGGTTLSYLCNERCEFVFARIDILAGNFRMICYDRSKLEPAPSGARFIAGPNGLVLPGILSEIRVQAKGIALKLMKTSTKLLHIRTAYPLVAAPNPQTVKITWRAAKDQIQILPA